MLSCVRSALVLENNVGASVLHTHVGYVRIGTSLLLLGTTCYVSSITTVFKFTSHLRVVCHVMDEERFDRAGWFTSKRDYTRGSLCRTGAAEDRLQMSIGPSRYAMAIVMDHAIMYSSSSWSRVSDAAADYLQQTTVLQQQSCLGARGGGKRLMARSKWAAAPLSLSRDALVNVCCALTCSLHSYS